MALSDIRATIASLPSTSKPRRAAITPENLAQEPVYVRFTKAEFECIEEQMWAEAVLPKGVHLTPRLMCGLFKAMLTADGIDFGKVKKLLARPDVIRK